MCIVADSDTFVVGLVGGAEEYDDAAAVVDTYVVKGRAALAQACIGVPTLASLVAYYALVGIVGA